MRKTRTELEVAEETVEAARAALRAHEGEVHDIRRYIEEASRLGNEEWLASLQEQLAQSIQLVHRLRRGVREEEERANRLRPN